MDRERENAIDPMLLKKLKKKEINRRCYEKRSLNKKDSGTINVLKNDIKPDNKNEEIDRGIDYWPSGSSSICIENISVYSKNTHENANSNQNAVEAENIENMIGTDQHYEEYLNIEFLEDAVEAENVENMIGTDQNSEGIEESMQMQHVEIDDNDVDSDDDAAREHTLNLLVQKTDEYYVNNIARNTATNEDIINWCENRQAHKWCKRKAVIESYTNHQMIDWYRNHNRIKWGKYQKIICDLKYKQKKEWLKYQMIIKHRKTHQQ